jgi:hypothetical protein
MKKTGTVFQMLDTNSMLTWLITHTDLTVFLCMLMIFLQEIPWQSQADILLYVTFCVKLEAKSYIR